tara:strand:+ start:1280 stop:2662 length:1383 start_codon:yes stop_codon:yes gene_type:complete
LKDIKLREFMWLIVRFLCKKLYHSLGIKIERFINGKPPSKLMSLEKLSFKEYVKKGWSSVKKKALPVVLAGGITLSMIGCDIFGLKQQEEYDEPKKVVAIFGSDWENDLEKIAIEYAEEHGLDKEDIKEMLIESYLNASVRNMNKNDLEEYLEKDNHNINPSFSSMTYRYEWNDFLDNISFENDDINYIVVDDPDDALDILKDSSISAGSDLVYLMFHGSPSSFGIDSKNKKKMSLTLSEVMEFAESDKDVVQENLSNAIVFTPACALAFRYEDINNTLAEALAYLSNRSVIVSQITVDGGLPSLGYSSVGDRITSFHSDVTFYGAFEEIPPDSLNDMAEINESLKEGDSISAKLYNWVEENNNSYMYFKFNEFEQAAYFINMHDIVIDDEIYDISITAYDYPNRWYAKLARLELTLKPEIGSGWKYIIDKALDGTYEKVFGSEEKTDEILHEIYDILVS